MKKNKFKLISVITLVLVLSTTTSFAEEITNEDGGSYFIDIFNCKDIYTVIESDYLLPEKYYTSGKIQDYNNCATWATKAAMETSLLLQGYGNNSTLDINPEVGGYKFYLEGQATSSLKGALYGHILDYNNNCVAVFDTGFGLAQTQENSIKYVLKESANPNSEYYGVAIIGYPYRHGLQILGWDDNKVIDCDPFSENEKYVGGWYVKDSAASVLDFSRFDEETRTRLEYTCNRSNWGSFIEKEGFTWLPYELMYDGADCIRVFPYEEMVKKYKYSFYDSSDVINQMVQVDAINSTWSGTAGGGTATIEGDKRYICVNNKKMSLLYSDKKAATYKIARQELTNKFIANNGDILEVQGNIRSVFYANPVSWGLKGVEGLEMYGGEQKALQMSDGSNCSARDLIYTSSNPSVLTVENGILKAARNVVTSPTEVLIKASRGENSTSFIVTVKPNTCKVTFVYGYGIEDVVVDDFYVCGEAKINYNLGKTRYVKGEYMLKVDVNFVKGKFYNIVGFSTSPNGGGTVYGKYDAITVYGDTTLYAIWALPEGHIDYTPTSTPTKAPTPTPSYVPVVVPTVAPTKAPTTIPTVAPIVTSGTWKKDNNGWQYSYSNGGYAKNGIVSIWGTDYYFDNNGYMKTGWQSINGKWYYFENSGAMSKNKWVGDYYLKSDGIMATNEWIGNYYVDGSGKWVPGKAQGSSNSTSSANAGWKKNNSGWWYQYSNGSYPKNTWAKIDDKWYHFNGAGYMQTGWLKDGGKWYYLKSSGAMATGWIKDGGKWYYLKSSGAMAANEWVGNYYLKGDGSMATNEWIGKYHVNASGVWDKTR